MELTSVLLLYHEKSNLCIVELITQTENIFTKFNRHCIQLSQEHFEIKVQLMLHKKYLQCCIS